MYNPHVLECGACLTPFKDQELVYPHFEDYLCVQCTPVFIQEMRKPFTWHENPLEYIKRPIQSKG